jgi:hypothetical protein
VTIQLGFNFWEGRRPKAAHLDKQEVIVMRIQR